MISFFQLLVLCFVFFILFGDFKRIRQNILALLKRQESKEDSEKR